MEENRIYTVATSHLDTVWRWELPKTIDVFIPDTIEKNIALLEKFPHYRFNFEGAFRYELTEEYYPRDFEEIQKYARQGRWCPSGSAYENGDVNIPSPEAILRNFLYGNRYFKEKLGRISRDVFLPDCFGFGWALPSIARHARLKGFTTQKLSWGAAYERPFNLGLWRGVDGKAVYACLNPLSYRNRFKGDVRGDLAVINKLADNGLTYHLPWTNCFYGTGDWGGAPSEESVRAVEESIRKNDKDAHTKVLAATSDEIFLDIDKLAKEKTLTLPVWDNELLMRSHGAGAYTSRAMSKRLNAQCEVLADHTEKACVAADMLTSYRYPKEILEKAWKRVIQHQFHDDITGTSTMLVYNDSWNDYFVSLNQFRSELEGATGAVANELDTSWCGDTAIIVSNPVAVRRKEAVSARIKLQHNAQFVRVTDKAGREIPSQVVRKQGKELDIVFLADVPSVGWRVYNAEAAEAPYRKKSALSVTEHMLENKKYRIRFNRNGDLASLFDKSLGKEMLSEPIKLALYHNTGELNYPSWELRKEDIDGTPYAFAHTPTFEIVENGAARVAVRITRRAESSAFIQTVFLDAESETVRIDNYIDWQERRTLLKAHFPVACANDTASYDLGLGYIRRGNNRENLYEVPAQKWADVTAKDGSCGVTVFSDCKYGWDKPTDSLLRLTCIHTPAGAFTKDARQDLQDIGRNLFSFGIYSHKGNLNSYTQLGAEMFCKPLCAFQTSSRREGRLGDSFSLLSVSSKSALVRAVKYAEDGDGIVIRINEGLGKENKNLSLTFCDTITQAVEIYGSEEERAPAKIKDGRLVFSLKPFEIKSFKIKTDTQRNKARENYKKLELPYNTNGISTDAYKLNCILQGSGCSLPDELLPETLTVKGVTFRLPHSNLPQNLLIPRGQTLDIPKSMTKLYILAASSLTDRNITVRTDSKERRLTVSAMREPYAVWDMAGLSQTAAIKNGDIGLELTHTHHPEGNLANQKAYFYLYEIDVRNCKKLTLPDDNRVVIMAMTAVKRFSSTRLITPVMDTVDENYRFGDIPALERLLDKADFVTIRAGKIQDQIKGGKGKGVKRDNIVTNIIRSYTKSEW